MLAAGLKALVKVLYPLHCAVVAVQAGEEKRFAALSKYFAVMTLCHCLEGLLPSGSLAQLLLAGVYALLVSDGFGPAARVFDRGLAPAARHPLIANALSSMQRVVDAVSARAIAWTAPLRARATELVLRALTGRRL